MQKIDTKDFFKNYAIFLGILVVLFSILIGMTRLSSKKWTEGLKVSVQAVLDEKEPQTWIVGQNLKIKSAFSTSAAVYELNCKNDAERYYAVTLRVVTFFGPMPTVFVYSKNKCCHFKGYYAVKGRVKKILENTPNDTRIAYWSEKVRNIVENSEREVSK